MGTSHRHSDIGRRGARFGPYSTGRAAEPGASEPAGEGPPERFDTVVRGYDRQQVEAFLEHRSRAEAELRVTLATAERRLREVTAELDRARAELAATGPVAAPTGFGARAEKLLRLAEAEAVEIRASASRESVTLIDQARVAAEQRRHESEQAVIARFRKLDEESQRRSTELEEREEKIAEQLTAGRREIERLHTEAAERAEKLRDEALAAAALIAERSRAQAAQTQDHARTELNRIAGLRADVYTELARLQSTITREIST